jgi:hypothetical protein
MRRLSTETAEAAAPDAAPKGFGTSAGDTRPVGAVACRSAHVAPRQAAQAARARSPGRRAPVEDSKQSALQGLRGASLKHRARDAGGTGGPAVLLLRSASMPRGVEVRGSFDPRCPAPPRTFRDEDR